MTIDPNEGQEPDVDVEDATALERRTVLGAFEFAKTRYVRSLTAETEAKFLANYARHRNQLAEEVANLRLLARARHESAWAAAQRYSAKAPHRVGKNGFAAPSTLDRANNFGIDKYYREAKKAAGELEEVNDLLRKRLNSLAEMDREITESVTLRENAARRQLDTPDGLAMAIRRDPLFERAYERVQALGPYEIPPAAAEANALSDLAAEAESVPDGSEAPAEGGDAAASAAAAGGTAETSATEPVPPPAASAEAAAAAT